MYDVYRSARAIDPIKLIVDLTCSSDRRARWRYVRALQFADEMGVKPRNVTAFIQDAGGLNAAIDRYDEMLDPESDFFE